MNDRPWGKEKLRAVLVLTGASMAASLAGPLPRTAGSPKPSEAAAAYDATRALVKPSADEWQWRHLPWTQSMAAAQKKSVAEGKPIFVAAAAQGSVLGCL